jgi:hypothetical protein
MDMQGFLSHHITSTGTLAHRRAQYPHLIIALVAMGRPGLASLFVDLWLSRQTAMNMSPDSGLEALDG